MKRILLLSCVCLLAYMSEGQILRPMSVRYNNGSVRGNIVYISNSIISTGGRVTTETPPGGTEANNGGTAINIDIDGTPPDTAIAIGSNWKYLANNTRPAGWETTGYSDAAWPAGNGQFGYGDGDETTCVPSGGGGTLCVPTGTKYITTYFRKTVNIVNPAAYSNFTLGVYRDDGIVVYVNGVEVYRDNMPGGAIAHATLASAAAADDGATLQTTTLATSAFVAGNNVIAVEIHQNNATSSDLSFDLQLIGNPVTTTSIIPYNSNWKYLDNDTRPAGWETTGYSDAAWASGNAQLGYGDGDEATIVSYGPDPNNKYITTYFRKTVNIVNPSSYASFIINLIRDDGAVVYVNGTEVARSNMPGGAITHTTAASSNVGGAAESTPNPYTIASSFFVNGNNTIAVEVHQDVGTSSDLSFDLELLASLDSTFNSSSANLNLASCSEVLWAGLFWGASQGNDGANTSWMSGETLIDIKVPGSSIYQTVTSQQTDYHNNTLVPGLPHTGYQCFSDITSLVNATNPNGTYTIANMVGPAGIINGCGGWTIVIAFANPSEQPRNLTVFDGKVIMNGGDPPLYVPITGFLTPPVGPVTCELGAVVYDGDRVSQDEFSFKQDANPLVGTYTNMTPNATSNLDDMWNSTISYKGAVLTNRNPAYQNTLGYDADIIDVPNAGNTVLGNSQTSASIRFSSPSENYFIQVVTTSISIFNPSFAVEKGSTDLNGGALVPGDVLRYYVNYQNVGNDASANTAIVDILPVATSFVPGSIRIDGIPKTDAAGDDEAEYDFVNRIVNFRIGAGATAVNGGVITATSSGSVQFDVYAASSCAILSCGTPTDNYARINYNGQTSGQSLYDSSGYLVSGCLTRGPISNTITGSCYVPSDTSIVNQCPATSISLPIARYAGYSFYSATPFNAGNAYNPSTPITQTGVYYAYFNSGAGCSDTITIRVYINTCPDIDDDDDGIPDYVEINLPAALQDADTDGIPNWKDTDYPGFVDNNSDGFNDNFDPAADSDNDGIPNFLDTNFAGFVDINSDGVNDNMDKDLDGIPNNFDLDSDNDGIPDVVESFGVDANGDGRIDNYSDTDNDGLSQNIDANNTGIPGSGNGLNAVDTDGDGVPNYLDLDSDNDGIPDVIEVYGTDSNNDGRIDGFTDADGDGYSDSIDADVGNDGTAENTANALLRTGSDGNSDGRCDLFTDKNMDGDSKPNPYDIDSDMDGIVDVIEAGFTDANSDGIIDGAVNSDGWNAAIAGGGSLSLPNTDGTGKVNLYDIDSDDDGIPDNVEGLPTLSYLLPAGFDSDADGLDDTYDDVVGFGGRGTPVNDQDGDLIPDYLDDDTDNDGLIDRIEGNDFNFNNQTDDDVALTGVDTDADGLDDKFDNSNLSAEGTSAYMGNGGSLTGDATPGSRTVVQRTLASYNERDWRITDFILDCNYLSLTGNVNGKTTELKWQVVCKNPVRYFEIQRSEDGILFTEINQVAAIQNAGVSSYAAEDDISIMAPVPFLYYRIKSVASSGAYNFSNILKIGIQQQKGMTVNIAPNPVIGDLQLSIFSDKNVSATISVLDMNGQKLFTSTNMLLKGSNKMIINETNTLPSGTYILIMEVNNERVIRKFNKLK